MSIYYESAMRKSQRLEDERKATLAKGERMGAAVMSMVALGGESAKTKAAKAALDDYAKNEGFLLDKDKGVSPLSVIRSYPGWLISAIKASKESKFPSFT